MSNEAPTTSPVAGSTEEELRERALVSLKKKRSFRASAISYLLVNALLVVIWAATGADYFWPIWVIGGWGIGLAFQAWDAYGRRHEITEDEVAREMERLKG